MQILSKTEKLILFLLLPFYLIGIVLHSIGATLPMMLAFTPYTIFSTSVLGFFFEVKERNKGLLVWAAVTFGVTLFLEIVGWRHHWSSVPTPMDRRWDMKLLGVPLLIGIKLDHHHFRHCTGGTYKDCEPLAAALVTASLTVLFDYVMEPVAIAFDYWTWAAVDIPLQNYIAWFCIAFVFAFVFARQKLAAVNKVPTLIVIVQFVFFVGLRTFAV
jgi:putative membrane protein